MSDQTTANNSQDPVLCKNGCGFFGNAATGGCCSKCHRENQKKEEQPVVSKPVKLEPVENSISPEKPSPMEVESTLKTEDCIVEKAQPVVETPKKRKKKKASYKNMMAGMMKSSSPTRDSDREKEGLRKVTGGGTFSKIEKI